LPVLSRDPVFVSNTWNWPFFETDFFFQIPEIGGSLILSNTGNRKFMKPIFPNTTGNSLILKIVKYLELAGIKILNTRPHTGMK
jgi:hypothetical protein